MKKNLIFIWSSIFIVIPVSGFFPTFFNLQDRTRCTLLSDGSTFPPEIPEDGKDIVVPVHAALLHIGSGDKETGHYFLVKPDPVQLGAWTVQISAVQLASHYKGCFH
jgi:hypothetical protein